MSLISYLSLIAVCLLIAFLRRRKRSSPPLPPGPKPLPVIGNLLDMPETAPWIQYERWFKAFQSDIVYLNAAGTDIVILNTYEAAIELFDKRSTIHSSRVQMPMVCELMGWEFYFPFMPYGDRWRAHKRVFHQAFNMNAAKEFQPQETMSTHKLLLRFIERPDIDVQQHLRHYAGDVILSVAYGIDVIPDGDPFLAISKKALHSLVNALIPGLFWVDVFPWLQYVPSFLAPFRRKAAIWHKQARSMVEVPFKVVKKNIRTGNFRPSFCSAGLERLQSDDSSEHDAEVVLQEVAATMFTAGSDTTVSVLSTLILALLKFPEVQPKAQAELDRVLNGSLPTFKDQESLPYVTATVLEAMRWNVAIPFGVPHSSIADDVYNGYFIPKGTMLIPNVWSMLYDEEMYPDPYRFNPDRYLQVLDGQFNPKVRDPRTACFGFGRRICAGRYMAFSSTWITAASILATMNVSKSVGADGTVIEPSGEYDDSILHTPKPFPCTVKPRSAHAESLIRSAVLEEEN